MRTPSVRAASTNPAAAIVLPDAVGCRKRKRQLLRVALGGGRRLELVLLFLLRLGFHVRAVAVGGLGRGLGRCDQLGEHAGERVDLMPPKLGSRGEPRRVVSEHALEPEHQRVTALPLVRGRAAPRLQLLDRVVERQSARGARREYDRRVLVGPEKWLSGPVLGAGGGLAETVLRLRR